MRDGTSKLELRKILLYTWPSSNWYYWNTFARKYKQEEAKLYKVFSHSYLQMGYRQSQNSMTLAKWTAYEMHFWLLWNADLK